MPSLNLIGVAELTWMRGEFQKVSPDPYQRRQRAFIDHVAASVVEPFALPVIRKQRRKLARMGTRGRRGACRIRMQKAVMRRPEENPIVILNRYDVFLPWVILTPRARKECGFLAIVWAKEEPDKATLDKLTQYLARDIRAACNAEVVRIDPVYAKQMQLI